MDMFRHFVAWSGIYIDNASTTVSTFWSEPFGLFITGSIFISCTVIVLHKAAKENCLDTIWYSLFGLSALSAFIMGVDKHAQPHNIIKTFLVLIAVRTMYNAYWHIRNYHKHVKL